MPKNSASNTQPIPNNTAARQTVEISAIAEDEDEDENIHESLEKDILDVDDPNSMFRQYVDAEEAEAREWLAANAEKKALEEAEKEEELDDESENPVWLITMGGKQNLELRKFLSSKRLSM